MLKTVTHGGNEPPPQGDSSTLTPKRAGFYAILANGEIADPERLAP
jgi:hypothetical protein